MQGTQQKKSRKRLLKDAESSKSVIINGKATPSGHLDSAQIISSAHAHGHVLVIINLFVVKLLVFLATGASLRKSK